MKKFTVRRSKWLRGDDDTMLLDSKGKMCCLGFAVNQICRIPKKNLLYKLAPNNVLENKDTIFTDIHTKYPSKVPNNKAFVTDAMLVNDNVNINDDEREKRLTKIFRGAGIEVTFKD